jgi:hypothetical protein
LILDLWKKGGADEALGKGGVSKPLTSSRENQRRCRFFVLNTNSIDAKIFCPVLFYTFSIFLLKSLSIFFGGKYLTDLRNQYRDKAAMEG